MRIHNGTVPDTVLIDAATTHDGVAPLSEQFLRGLSEPELGHTHAYILADDQVVALAAGMGRIILYVEADNVPAVVAYEKLGFEEVENHVLYAHESAEN